MCLLFFGVQLFSHCSVQEIVSLSAFDQFRGEEATKGIKRVSIIKNRCLAHEDSC